jgi:hypothetical protein
MAFRRRSPAASLGRPSSHDLRLFGDDLFDVAQEPGIEVRDRVDLLDREAFAHRLRDDAAAGRRLARQRRGDDRIAPGAFQFLMRSR